MRRPVQQFEFACVITEMGGRGRQGVGGRRGTGRGLGKGREGAVTQQVQNTKKCLINTEPVYSRLLFARASTSCIQKQNKL